MTTPDQLLDAAREGLAGGADQAAAGECAARVSLWAQGRCVAQTEASAGDPLGAVRAAAATLADHERDGAALFVEAAIDQQPLQVGGLRGLLAMQPDGSGLLLRDGEREARGWPFDALRSEGRRAGWVKRLNRAVRPPGARLAASTAVERFATLEAAGPVEPPGGAATYTAPRSGGFRIVQADEVLPDRLTGAALQAAAWLLRHQRPDGLFAYEFSPQTQSWSAADSIVRQAGCAWAIALVGRLRRDRAVSRAADAAIGGLLQATLRRDGPGRLYYLAAPGEPPRLGAIPLLLLAALELGQPTSATRDVIERLTATLLAIQEPSGRIGVTARGLDLEGSETYYAGQVVLALARLHGARRRDRYARAIAKSIQHYHERWADESERDLSFTTWMLQACDTWHQLSGADDVDDAAAYGFAMADWALESQHLPDHPHPLWSGAFQDTPGIGTAAYAEGIAAALALAQRVGDAEREARYRAALFNAMRFLLQLTVESSDAAFVGGDEQIGAVRSALHRSGLRCDNAQHLIMAALRTRALAFEQDS